MSAESDDTARSPKVSGVFPAVTERSGLQTGEHEGVLIVVTQAFDGHGNNLVRADGPSFDGFPGVTLHVVSEDGRSATVTLSPIHGDPRKAGFESLEVGTRCRLYPFEGGPELEKSDGHCNCEQGGSYYKLFLSERRGDGEVCLVCNVWGCHRSRIIDDEDLLSWVEY